MCASGRGTSVAGPPSIPFGWCGCIIICPGCDASLCGSVEPLLPAVSEDGVTLGAFAASGLPSVRPFGCDVAFGEEPPPPQLKPTAATPASTKKRSILDI